MSTECPRCGNETEENRDLVRFEDFAESTAFVSETVSLCKPCWDDTRDFVRGEFGDD